MTKPFIVSETELVEKMKTFLDECDSDELGRIAEEIFGVEEDIILNILPRERWK